MNAEKELAVEVIHTSGGYENIGGEPVEAPEKWNARCAERIRNLAKTLPEGSKRRIGLCQLAYLFDSGGTNARVLTVLSEHPVAQPLTRELLMQIPGVNLEGMLGVKRGVPGEEPELLDGVEGFMDLLIRATQQEGLNLAECRVIWVANDDFIEGLDHIPEEALANPEPVIAFITPEGKIYKVRIAFGDEYAGRYVYVNPVGKSSSRSLDLALENMEESGEFAEFLEIVQIEIQIIRLKREQETSEAQEKALLAKIEEIRKRRGTHQEQIGELESILKEKRGEG